MALAGSFRWWATRELVRVPRRFRTSRLSAHVTPEPCPSSFGTWLGKQPQSCSAQRCCRNDRTLSGQLVMIRLHEVVGLGEVSDLAGRLLGVVAVEIISREQSQPVSMAVESHRVKPPAVKAGLLSYVAEVALGAEHWAGDLKRYE